MSIDEILTDFMYNFTVSTTAHKAKAEAKTAISQLIQAARIEAASEIFSLAHKLAREDKTMVGSEELRHHHYYNAIAQIGEFDGR